MIRLNSFGIGGPTIISEDYNKTDTVNIKNIIEKKQTTIDTVCYNIYIDMNEQNFIQEINNLKNKNIIYNIDNEKTNKYSIYNGNFIYSIKDKFYPASFNINFKDDKLFYFKIIITDSITSQKTFDIINDYFNNKYGTYNYFNNENNYQQYWWFNNSKYIFNLKLSKYIIIEFRNQNII